MSSSSGDTIVLGALQRHVGLQQLLKACRISVAHSQNLDRSWNRILRCACVLKAKIKPRPFYICNKYTIIDYISHTGIVHTMSIQCIICTPFSNLEVMKVTMDSGHII